MLSAAHETDPQSVGGVHGLHINVPRHLLCYFFPLYICKAFQNPDIQYGVRHSLFLCPLPLPSPQLVLALLRTSNSCYFILSEHNYMTKIF